MDGIDYAWARPDPDCLYRSGKRFVSRYLSYDDTGKNLSFEEAEQLTAAGLSIVCNWEWQTGDARGGYAKGQIYAHEAIRQANACGMPSGKPIYFSVDYDPAGYYGDIHAYFEGILSVLPRSQVGAYGGYGTIRYLFDNGLITWGWQTYAWSHGQWDSRAHVRQVLNGYTMCGSGDGGLDLDVAVQPEFGQWKIGDNDMLTEFQARAIYNLDRWLTAVLNNTEEVTLVQWADGTTDHSYPNVLHSPIATAPVPSDHTHDVVLPSTTVETGPAK